MSILHLETDAVMMLVAQFRQQVEQMRSQMDSSGNSALSIDWIGPSRDEFVAEMEAFLRSIQPQLDADVTIDDK